MHAPRSIERADEGGLLVNAEEEFAVGQLSLEREHQRLADDGNGVEVGHDKRSGDDSKRGQSPEACAAEIGHGPGKDHRARRTSRVGRAAGKGLLRRVPHAAAIQRLIKIVRVAARKVDEIRGFDGGRVRGVVSGDSVNDGKRLHVRAEAGEMLLAHAHPASPRFFTLTSRRSWQADHARDAAVRVAMREDEFVNFIHHREVFARAEESDEAIHGVPLRRMGDVKQEIGFK